MGAGGFGVLGWRMGRVVSEFSTGQERLLWPWGLLLAGLPLGALVAPYLTLKPMHRTIDYINSIPGSTLVAGILGLLVGLIVGSPFPCTRSPAGRAGAFPLLSPSLWV